MFYFDGSSCSLCGVPLRENDDIVACPVCGSPHHRSCYKENAGCGNDHLHEEGFSWKRDTAGDQAPEEENTGRKVIYCGICGAENSSGRLYCHNCGKPLFDDAVGSDSEHSEYSDFNRVHYDFSDKEQLDGVPMGDVKRLLGGSAIMYAPMFYQMQKTGKKVWFSIMGLLFPAFWYLNRKMYLRGILIILYNLLNYCYSLLFYGVYKEMYDAAMNFDSDAIMELFNRQPVIMGGFMGIGAVAYIISIVSALYGNNIFRKWSIRRIKRLRKKAKTDEQYTRSLDAAGRPGIGVTLFIILLYFVVTLLAERFIPTII